MRDFWRLESGGIRDVASRLAGSSDLYADDGRSPYASVNFVTAHDGFTLRDLVSYDRKHNEANGEHNRDGTDNNRSWNCGVEGETDDPAIVALRRRQAANLMATLCLSSGRADDHRRRRARAAPRAATTTPTCQDNEISWMDWRPDDAWLDVYEIAKTALRLRREHPALRQRHFLEGRPTVEGGPKDLAWMHPDGREMTGADWFDETPAHVRDVRLRRPAARPRPARRAAARLVVPDRGSTPHGDPGKAKLPANEWVSAGEVVLCTDTGHPVGRGGLRRRGHRHRAALADRAPPALTTCCGVQPRRDVGGCGSSRTSLIQAAAAARSGDAAFGVQPVGGRDLGDVAELRDQHREVPAPVDGRRPAGLAVGTSQHRLARPESVRANSNEHAGRAPGPDLPGPPCSQSMTQTPPSAVGQHVVGPQVPVTGAQGRRGGSSHDSRATSSSRRSASRPANGAPARCSLHDVALPSARRRPGRRTNRRPGRSRPRRRGGSRRHLADRLRVEPWRRAARTGRPARTPGACRPVGRSRATLAFRAYGGTAGGGHAEGAGRLLESVADRTASSAPAGRSPSSEPSRPRRPCRGARRHPAAPGGSDPSDRRAPPEVEAPGDAAASTSAVTQVSAGSVTKPSSAADARWSFFGERPAPCSRRLRRGSSVTVPSKRCRPPS